MTKSKGKSKKRKKQRRSKLRKRIILLICSIIIPSILLILNYNLSLNPIASQAEEELLAKTAYYFKNFEKNKNFYDEYKDSIVCINVSHSKELITSYDPNLHIENGNIAVTDRAEIAKALVLMGKSPKYILLDINLDSIYKTPNDAILREAMQLSSPLLIPTTQTSKVHNQDKWPVKFGYASFNKSIYTNRFTKFSLINDTGFPSIAAQMYKDLNDHIIRKRILYFTDNNAISWNSIILNQRIKPFPKYNAQLDFNYFDLKENFNKLAQKDIVELTKNKIVLIGDFNDQDLHPTEFGKIPGIIIIFNSYLALLNADHKITLTFLISLYLIFFFIVSYFFFDFDKKMSEKIYKLVKTTKVFKILSKYSINPLISFIFADFFKIGFLLYFVSLFYYLVYDIHIEILSTTIVFSILIYLKTIFIKVYEEHAT